MNEKKSHISAAPRFVEMPVMWKTLTSLPHYFANPSGFTHSNKTFYKRNKCGTFNRNFNCRYPGKIIVVGHVSSCIVQDEFFFQKYKYEAFKKFFIDTGDGGFQIFETPLHAIIYTIYFASAVRVFNSFHFYPKLRKLIGPITLRYAITFDSIYKIGEHFYGTSIINNARILSKDSLNRFLIDQNTQEWFMLNINGVEHLPNLILNEIKKLDPFKIDYDSKIECDPGIFPDLPISGPQKRGSHIIQNLCIQKIEDIEVKGTKLSIYNIQIQAFLRIFWEDDKTGKKSPQLPLTITIGNLNTSGLN